MNSGRYIFTQLCDFLPRRQFERIVAKYEGNKYVKSFTCWSHLLVLIFGQITNRESLRDLIGTLEPHRRNFHHLGFGSLSRSNLSKANEVRDVRVFEDLMSLMVRTAQSKRNGIKDSILDVDGNVYAFDSTTISLCISSFWWSKLHHNKGGVKLHTLYDVQTCIPVFNIITNGNVADSRMMNRISYETGSYYVFDRVYMDTAQLYNVEMAGGTFVVREKHKMKFVVLHDNDVDDTQSGVIADQIVKLDGTKPKKSYPKPIRRVTYYDKQGNRTFVFYTNKFDIPAEKVALLYKYRWRIELFFKWLKQHLRIKELYGTSENAVKIQIYAAIITYCLVAVVESELNIKSSTYEVLRMLSVALLTKMPLRELLEKVEQEPNCHFATQLTINFF